MVVQVKHLCKNYGPRRAVSDLTFGIDEGDVVGFLGPNGAGKTTTMNMLTGFLSPSEGEVVVNGISMQDAPEEAKRHLGYLPETPPLYLDMLVSDYLRYAAALRGVAKSQVSARLDFVTARCGLGDVKGRVIGHLSKGYRQRVGIAQALISDPKIIILDEPTVGLDPLQIIEIRELIKDLGRDHTLILSTHILPEVTMTCKKVIILNEGRIVAEDSYETLSARLRETNKVYVRGTALSEDVLKPIRALPEIVQVSAVSDGGLPGFVVESKLGFDLEALLIERAVGEKWGLKELRPYALSLEEVFLKLTREEGGKSKGEVA